MRIKELRERNGMQQKELALGLGVSQPTVSDWESGRKTPAGKRLEQIADFFDVSVDYLLGRSSFETEEAGMDAHAEAYGPAYEALGGDIEKYRKFKDAEAEDAMRDAAEWAEARKQHQIVNAIPLSPILHKIPVVGIVRAGAGGIAMDDVEGHEFVSSDLVNGSADQYFYLRVEGDSMSPEIKPGDLVLVRKQDSVDSGQIAVVCIDGEEGVVKRVRHSGCEQYRGPESLWITLESLNPVYEPRHFVAGAVRSIQVCGLVVHSVRKY